MDRLTTYFIASDTQHAQFCWQWLKFLATQPASVAAGSLPAHITTAESAEFIAHVGAERAALLLTTLAGASNQRTLLGNYEPWLNPGAIWLNAVAARASRAEVDVDSALASAQDKFNRYRECVIIEEAFENYEAWRACALQADPDLSRRYD